MYADAFSYAAYATAPASRRLPIDLTAGVDEELSNPGEGEAGVPLVVQVDASTTRLAPSATITQLEANFRFAKNVAATTARPHSVIFWDACTEPRDPRWWVRTYYPNGTWGEDTLEGHQSGSLAGTPAPIFVAGRQG